MFFSEKNFSVVRPLLCLLRQNLVWSTRPKQWNFLGDLCIPIHICRKLRASLLEAESQQTILHFGKTMLKASAFFCRNLDSSSCWIRKALFFKSMLLHNLWIDSFAHKVSISKVLLEEYSIRQKPWKTFPSLEHPKSWHTNTSNHYRKVLKFNFTFLFQYRLDRYLHHGLNQRHALLHELNDKCCIFFSHRIADSPKEQSSNKNDKDLSSSSYFCKRIGSISSIKVLRDNLSSFKSSFRSKDVVVVHSGGIPKLQKLNKPDNCDKDCYCGQQISKQQFWLLQRALGSKHFLAWELFNEKPSILFLASESLEYENANC